MHRIYGLLAIVTVAAGLIAGCEKSSVGARNTAVVDVVAVAKALGKDTAFQQQIEQVNQNLNQQLQQIQANLQEQLNTAIAEAGENPDEEAQQRLVALRNEANRRLQQARLVAQQRMQEVQTALGNQFRDEIKPIAEQIAKKRGASVVLMNAGGVLWYDSAIDITADVIGEMRTLSNAAPPVAAAPTTTPAAPATTPAPEASASPAPSPSVQ